MPRSLYLIISRHIFYIFTLKSSIEFGPWRPTSNATVERNPYSWTRLANIVFLEQPVGVGFSYTLEEDLIDNFNDYRAAHDNLQVVKKFFEKFPERAGQDFYLASESYGGHYIPHWTLQVLNDPSTLKQSFRGYLVGNPYTSFASGSIAGINVMWGLQLLPQPEWCVPALSPHNTTIEYHLYRRSMLLCVGRPRRP